MTIVSGRANARLLRRLGQAWVLAMTLLAVAGTATAFAQATYTCRASALRVQTFAPLPAATIEPFTANANPANGRCNAAQTDLVSEVLGTNTLPLGLGSAELLFAETRTNNDGFARAGVLDLALNVPVIGAVEAEVLTSEARSFCTPNNTFGFSGSSRILRVVVAGQTIEPIPGTYRDIAVPGGVLRIELAKQTPGANQITQQALVITATNPVTGAILARVVVGEAIADIHGSCEPPCPEGKTRDPVTRQCVDPPCPEGQERVNGQCVPVCPAGTTRDPVTKQCVQPPCPEGQERVNGECVPVCPEGQERVNGQCVPVCPEGQRRNPQTGRCEPGRPPQCSDEIDNDGDGRIDYPNDPGCASPQDDDETDGGTPPQCSDGRDNDGDGFIDYPYDPGCDNRDDNDERDRSAPECSDGIDNDRDGMRDFPLDSGCKSATDDDEAAGFISGGGGYDDLDRRRVPEDRVEPGEMLRFGGVLPCDLSDPQGPNLTVTFHRGGQEREKLVHGELIRAYCRNDPFITPENPLAEFDTYVGTGRFRLKDGTVMLMEFTLIDRGEPGAPYITGVDYFQIQPKSSTIAPPRGDGTLDEGNIQAHTPGERVPTTTQP
jgi:hypothetical protein